MGSDGTYPCYYCGRPIIIREGNEHQPYHLEGGWECWKARNPSDEVYSCYKCGGPIIFRGRNTYHLESGWECWRS